MPELNRREFLRAAAMTAAAAAVHSRDLSTVEAGEGRPRMAEVAEGAVPLLRDRLPRPGRRGGGRVRAVAGDRRAAVNKGLLCVKGYHVALGMYGKDRLTKPLLRTNGGFTEITWEKALDVMADRVMAAPKRFAFYGSGQWTIPEGYVANKLLKGGLGNNHVDPNARLCMASAVTGFIATYGVDEPACCYDDLDKCDVLILWGNNPAEMHPVLFSRVIDRRSRAEKVTIIDIGTRRTRSTEYADHYLEFRPHTDLAIANGIAHLLLKNGTWNREFVKKHTNFRADSTPPSLKGKAITFEEYRKALEPYTPERVEEISGVPAAEIRRLAGLFGDPKLRISSLWCMGMNQHTRGTAINTLVHGVHLLSGHWGREGDGPQSLTGQPSACGTVREVGTLAHALPGGRLVAKKPHRESAEKLWNLKPGSINPKPGYHTVKMWEQFVKPASEGGDIDTIWVQVTNPGQTLPNRKKLFAAKAAEKFLIVSDVYPTATTELADLVLPSAMWVEKNGIFGNSERRTQQWFRAVMPPDGARDDCWQTIALARRLYDRGHPGMKDKDGKFIFHMDGGKDGESFPIWDWKRYYEVNVDAHLYEEYRAFTRMKHKDLAPYDVLVKARGLRWPVVKTKDGAWRETRYRFVEGEDPYVKAGAGFQFYHSTTGDDRAQIWFRPYEDPPEMPDEDFPFWLCTGRVLEHWHTGTMTMRIPQLKRAMPSAYVELNPADAKRLGIQNGETVRVETRRGGLDLRAWLNGRGAPPEGSIFVPFFDESLLVNDLTLEAFDPFSKQPDYKKCAARVQKTRGI